VLSVRSANPHDSAAIAPLLAELGYPAQPHEVGGRLERMSVLADAGVLVAEAEGQVIGVAAYQIIPVLERPRPKCHISALVVAGAHRRRRAGGALVAAIERIARERGCFRLELTTRADRLEAFRFYTAVGFVERPRRLVKSLD
jgi:ribosomal protein S18 acetylase RimI-like enzyme